jgi:hypothetical protein
MINGQRSVDATRVNAYVSYKQHLATDARGDDVPQVVRDIVALHSTSSATPYLTLWARVKGFQRSMLEDELYEQRRLARVLCMRNTVHVIPSEDLPCFYQTYQGRPKVADRRMMPEHLLVMAGLSDEAGAPEVKRQLDSAILAFLDKHGPADARAINRAVPELQAKVRHDVGKPYEGQFSIGGRLIRSLCSEGLLIRARPRGTWRSSQYQYAVLAAWLPEIDLGSVSWEEAQACLVQRYLAAFGPATVEDVVWWTGLNKGEIEATLAAQGDGLQRVEIQGWPNSYLMLAEDARRLRAFRPARECGSYLLPALDPLIMGYCNRDRFLAPSWRRHVFDRAGNAVPTVWKEGRVVGAWGQRKDGGVVYGLFEPIGQEAEAQIDQQARRLEDFLEGEYVAPGIRTAFTRSLNG